MNIRKTFFGGYKKDEVDLLIAQLKLEEENYKSKISILENDLKNVKQDFEKEAESLKSDLDLKDNALKEVKTNLNTAILEIKKLNLNIEENQETITDLQNKIEEKSLSEKSYDKEIRKIGQIYVDAREFSDKIKREAIESAILTANELFHEISLTKDEYYRFLNEVSSTKNIVNNMTVNIEEALNGLKNCMNIINKDEIFSHDIYEKLDKKKEELIKYLMNHSLENIPALKEDKKDEVAEPEKSEVIEDKTPEEIEDEKPEAIEDEKPELAQEEEVINNYESRILELSKKLDELEAKYSSRNILKDNENNANDEKFISDQTPATDESPKYQEVSASDESPAADERPKYQEVSASDESPAADESPKYQEVSASDESPAADESPKYQEASATDESPAADESPKYQEASASDEFPVVAESPKHQEVSVADDLTDVNGNDTQDEIPAKDENDSKEEFSEKEKYSKYFLEIEKKFNKQSNGVYSVDMNHNPEIMRKINESDKQEEEYISFEQRLNAQRENQESKKPSIKELLEKYSNLK